jgi:hypothetical protein
VSSGSVLILDAGQVLKRPVLCRHCDEERLFSLRDIIESPELKCHGCGHSICISDSIYTSLIREIRNTLAAIDSIQAAPSFIK